MSAPLLPGGHPVIVGSGSTEALSSPARLAHQKGASPAQQAPVHTRLFLLLLSLPAPASERQSRSFLVSPACRALPWEPTGQEAGSTCPADTEQPRAPAGGRQVPSGPANQGTEMKEFVRTWQQQEHSGMRTRKTLMKRNRRPREQGKASIAESFSEGLESVLHWSTRWSMNLGRAMSPCGGSTPDGSGLRSGRRGRSCQCRAASSLEKKGERQKGWGKTRGERTNVAIK